jgi:hypothetical protein
MRMKNYGKMIRTSLFDLNTVKCGGLYIFRGIRVSNFEWGQPKMYRRLIDSHGSYCPIWFDILGMI